MTVARTGGSTRQPAWIDVCPRTTCSNVLDRGSRYSKLLHPHRIRSAWTSQDCADCRDGQFGTTLKTALDRMLALAATSGPLEIRYAVVGLDAVLMVHGQSARVVAKKGFSNQCVDRTPEGLSAEGKTGTRVPVMIDLGREDPRGSAFVLNGVTSLADTPQASVIRNLVDTHPARNWTPFFAAKLTVHRGPTSRGDKPPAVDAARGPCFISYAIDVFERGT